MGKNFNGSSDYYQVGGGNTATYTKWFSLWFKADALPASQACLYARYTVTAIGSYHRYCGVFLNSSGTVAVRQYYQDAMSIVSGAATTTTSISTGTWYHVLATNNNLYRVIWLNGTNETNNSTAVTGSFYREIWVGAQSGPTNYFDGTLLDVCEWEDDNITEAQGDLVAPAIYNGYISPQFYWAQSLLLFYPFFSDHAYSYGSSQMTLTKNGSPSDAEHLPILYPEDIWYQYKSRETGMQGWDRQIIPPHRRKLVVVDY